LAGVAAQYCAEIMGMAYKALLNEIRQRGHLASAADAVAQ
jgi:hypothetical protein